MPRPRLFTAVAGLIALISSITIIIINPAQYDVTGLLAFAGVALLLTVVIDK